MWQWFVDALDSLTTLIGYLFQKGYDLVIEVVTWGWDLAKYLGKELFVWAYEKVALLLEPLVAMLGFDPATLRTSLNYFIDAAQTINVYFPIITITNIYLAALTGVIVLRGLKIVRHWLPFI